MAKEEKSKLALENSKKGEFLNDSNFGWCQQREMEKIPMTQLDELILQKNRNSSTKINTNEIKEKRIENFEMLNIQKQLKLSKNKKGFENNGVFLKKANYEVEHESLLTEHRIYENNISYALKNQKSVRQKKDLEQMKQQKSQQTAFCFLKNEENTQKLEIHEKKEIMEIFNCEENIKTEVDQFIKNPILENKLLVNQFFSKNEKFTQQLQTFGSQNNMQKIVSFELKPPSKIKYTRALIKLWDSVNQDRISLQLNAINVDSPNNDLLDLPSKKTQIGKIYTNHMNCAFWETFKNLRMLSEIAKSNYFPTYHNSIDDNNLAKFLQEKPLENLKLWNNFTNKFNTYKLKHLKDKHLVNQNRYGDSDRSISMDSDDELTIKSDLYTYREKVMRLPQNLEIRFDDLGNLKTKPKLLFGNSSTGGRKSNSLLRNSKTNEKGQYKSFRIIQKPPKLSEVVKNLSQVPQYPFLSCFSDFKSHLPNFVNKYVSNFANDICHRERQHDNSQYFLSRISRYCLEDPFRYSIGIRNELKLPYFMVPQSFDFESEIKFKQTKDNEKLFNRVYNWQNEIVKKAKPNYKIKQNEIQNNHLTVFESINDHNYETKSERKMNSNKMNSENIKIKEFKIGNLQKSKETKKQNSNRAIPETKEMKINAAINEKRIESKQVDEKSKNCMQQISKNPSYENLETQKHTKFEKRNDSAFNNLNKQNALQNNKHVVSFENDSFANSFLNQNQNQKFQITEIDSFHCSKSKKRQHRKQSIQFHTKEIKPNITSSNKLHAVQKINPPIQSHQSQLLLQTELLEPVQQMPIMKRYSKRTKNKLEFKTSVDKLETQNDAKDVRSKNDKSKTRTKIDAKMSNQAPNIRKQEKNTSKISDTSNNPLIENLLPFNAINSDSRVDSKGKRNDPFQIFDTSQNLLVEKRSLENSLNIQTNINSMEELNNAFRMFDKSDKQLSEKQSLNVAKTTASDMCSKFELDNEFQIFENNHDSLNENPLIKRDGNSSSQKMKNKQQKNDEYLAFQKIRTNEQQIIDNRVHSQFNYTNPPNNNLQESDIYQHAKNEQVYRKIPENTFTNQEEKTNSRIFESRKTPTDCFQKNQETEIMKQGKTENNKASLGKLQEIEITKQSILGDDKSINVNLCGFKNIEITNSTKIDSINQTLNAQKEKPIPQTKLIKATYFNKQKFLNIWN